MLHVLDYNYNMASIPIYFIYSVHCISSLTYWVAPDLPDPVLHEQLHAAPGAGLGPAEAGADVGQLYNEHLRLAKEEKKGC